jgi:hypothetical protein
MKKEEESPTRMIPLTQWNKYHPWPSLGGLRNLVFHSSDNGFEQAVRRVGGRILIDEVEFFKWANIKDAQAKQEKNRQ